jgi:hypothetical protein
MDPIREGRTRAGARARRRGNDAVVSGRVEVIVPRESAGTGTGRSSRSDLRSSKGDDRFGIGLSQRKRNQRDLNPIDFRNSNSSKEQADGVSCLVWPRVLLLPKQWERPESFSQRSHFRRNPRM